CPGAHVATSMSDLKPAVDAKPSVFRRTERRNPDRLDTRLVPSPRQRPAKRLPGPWIDSCSSNGRDELYRPCPSAARHSPSLPLLSTRSPVSRARTRRAERRRFALYDVNLLVLMAGGVGRTANLSETGVLIETDQLFQPMEKIDFDLVLEELDPERPYWMRCQ